MNDHKKLLELMYQHSYQFNTLRQARHATMMVRNCKCNCQMHLQLQRTALQGFACLPACLPFNRTDGVDLLAIVDMMA